MHAPVRFASCHAATRLLLCCALTAALGAGCSGSDSQSNTDSENGNATEGDGHGEDVDASTGKLDGAVRDASAKPVADGSVAGDAGKAKAQVATGLDGGQTGASAPPDATTPVPDGGAVTPPKSDLCHLKGYDVGVLGDSYIQLSGDFTRLLQDTARSAGALGADDTYVDHSLSGASMNGFPNIPAQWPDAVADSKRRGGTGPKLVIMDGGGNDVLVNNRPCLDPASVAAVEQDATCVKVVDDTLATAQKLFDQAVSDGVQATIYFFYPHLPKSSVGAGPNANNILDYSTPRAKELCDKQTKAPCYFVDLRPAFDDPANPGWPRDGLIAFDGIHPTLMGSTIMAAEVWKVMQAQCLASK